MNIQIKKLDMVVPTTDNPFGKLELEVEIPFTLVEGKNYPATNDNLELTTSEKSIALMVALKDSLIEDLYASN